MKFIKFGKRRYINPEAIEGFIIEEFESYDRRILFEVNMIVGGAYHSLAAFDTFEKAEELTTILVDSLENAHGEFTSPN